jgi:regulatory protein
VEEIYTHALKLLRARDYTVVRLRQKLEERFGSVPDEVIELLLKKNFLNDRRFAENYVAKRKKRGAAALREELQARGVRADVIHEIVSQTDWPSLQAVMKAKMTDWNLRPPLQQRDAARLFRVLLRLGYEEDAIREEIENLHEQ